MKKTIIALLLVPTLAAADVTIHENEFKIDDVAKGSHFWARIYNWSAWANTAKQNSLNLHTNSVKKAYDDGDAEYSAPELEETDLETLLGDVEGPALYEFYENRIFAAEDDPLDPADIGGPSGLVTTAKVAVDLPQSFDVDGLNVARISDLMKKADQPHISSEVSKEFVHSFVDPLHSAHKEIDALKDSKINISILNAGRDYYQCSNFNNLLKLNGVANGITTYDGDFRIYLINTVTELDAAGEYPGKHLIEGSPLKVFKQEIIYSSSLIKSGETFLSFYKNADGGLKLVMNSVVVASSQLEKAPGKFTNGTRLIAEAFSGIKFENGEAVLNSKNLDLSPATGNCSKGLSKGMGRYALGLAQSIAK